MSLDNPECIPNPKGWYNHDHTEMFHGIMPVQGGAHRPRLEERLSFNMSGCSEDELEINIQAHLQSILTYITRLHPCATAIVQSHSRQRRRSSSSKEHVYSTRPKTRRRAAISFRRRVPKRVQIASLHSCATLLNDDTSHCKPKSGTMGRQRLYPST